MTRLYIVPIGSKWIEEFERTVVSPVDLTDIDVPPALEETTEARIWGTSAGEQKREFFNAMEPGDALLFYTDGEFFASGRVGVRFQDVEFGEAIWGSDDSGFIYTVTDYEEISVSPDRIGDLLGYGDGWYPRGFMRVSESAVNSLLTEYNSVFRYSIAVSRSIASFPRSAAHACTLNPRNPPEARSRIGPTTAGGSGSSSWRAWSKRARLTNSSP